MQIERVYVIFHQRLSVPLTAPAESDPQPVQRASTRIIRVISLRDSRST